MSTMDVLENAEWSRLFTARLTILQYPFLRGVMQALQFITKVDKAWNFKPAENFRHSYYENFLTAGM